MMNHHMSSNTDPPRVAHSEHNDGMTVFKPESSFYFTGEVRKRTGVLVTTVILMIMA